MSAEDKVVEDDMATSKGSSATGGAKEETSEIIKTVIYALLITLVFRTLFFQPFTIPSASMEPNLYEGDYIVVSKWDYGYSKYSFQWPLPFIKGRIMEKAAKRGDIVVFKLPRNPKVDYIKRVVGVPGDRIQMRHNQLYINDIPVAAKNLGAVTPQISYDSQYATKYEESLPEGSTHFMQDLRTDGPADDTPEYIVPADHYFMMGDNRDNSIDSRYAMDDPIQPGVDFVPAENLEGRATMVLVSWNEGSSIWKPWTWLNLRWDRLFKSLK
ncbi:signal peptidase I [Asticcacaulis sp. ZE23SCel15]|uniref:signal peptidase I n=1 Tax=Asticcacaulis sp. ZE23SCel15 TaxID=3059027 RepID=UPI00265E4252|nr:signal peptidase I [Asticcacaulis sp. ZE23SCel15]WKL56485.1 signal peptidase I [Asticcacaulis sp. ZE23SCel15]